MAQISYTKIFRFWVPLAATWLMMSLEGPFIAAVIARLAEPKYNLAAYGIAFSFALIVEAPIIMILSASVAMVSGSDSFRKLRRFTYFLNGIITAGMAVFLIPSIFYFIAEKIVHLPQDIAQVTYVTCLILLPWPSAIGYRRFYQGVLIRRNLTRRVAYGTVIRLTTMATTALILSSVKLTGAYVGAASLAVGVVAEAVVSRIMVHNALNDVLKVGEPEQDRISYRSIVSFYYPLALTTILFLGVHPLVTFFLGKSRFPIESFAVLPVVNSLVFIFRGLGLSFQEVGVALLGNRFEAYRPLRNFALIMGTIMTLCLVLIAFTPAATFWYHYVSGLPEELSRFSYLPTQIMVVMPALTVLISFQRSILICGKRTGPITGSTLVEVLLIVTVLFTAIHYVDAVGVVGAALAYLAGRVGANLYLFSPCSQVLKRFQPN